MREQNDVRIFMEACGQLIQPYANPGYPPVGRFDDPKIHEHIARNSQVNLYMKLIAEEFEELLEGHKNKDVVEVADACGDLIWVILGFCNSLGVNMAPVWREIASSNMSKTVDGNVIKRDDGKILKPDTYFPPNIQRALGLTANE
jgi:NTP pyrophosphatase (non-canonical NTP hydrolase)